MFVDDQGQILLHRREARHAAHFVPVGHLFQQAVQIKIGRQHRPIVIGFDVVGSHHVGMQLAHQPNSLTIHGQFGHPPGVVRGLLCWGKAGPAHMQTGQ